MIDTRKDIAVTKSHIHLLCGLGLLAGIIGILLSLDEILRTSDARGLLIASAIVIAGSLIAAAIACTADKKNE